MIDARWTLSLIMLSLTQAHQKMLRGVIFVVACDPRLDV